MESTTNIIDYKKNTLTAADTSGLSTVIDLSNYTAFLAQVKMFSISRMILDSEDRIYNAFDRLSDEIGVTHIETFGEVIVENE